jgi:hypothetical protein
MGSDTGEDTSAALEDNGDEEPLVVETASTTNR